MYFMEAKKQAEREALEERAQERRQKHKQLREQMEMERKKREEDELAQTVALSKITAAADHERRNTKRMAPASVTAIQSAPLRPNLVVETPHPADNEWHDVKVKCSYVGTFELGTGHVDRQDVKYGIRVMQNYVHKGRPAILILCLEGIKVIDADTNKVAMAHSLNRINLCSVDNTNSLFGFVAKNLGGDNKYCHVFKMAKLEHAEAAHGLVTKAFQIAYAVRGLDRRSDPRTDPQHQSVLKPSTGIRGSTGALASTAAAGAGASGGGGLRQPMGSGSMGNLSSRATETQYHGLPASPPGERDPQRSPSPSAASILERARQANRPQRVREWATQNPLTAAPAVPSAVEPIRPRSATAGLNAIAAMRPGSAPARPPPGLAPRSGTLSLAGGGLEQPLRDPRRAMPATANSRLRGASQPPPLATTTAIAEEPPPYKTLESEIPPRVSPMPSAPPADDDISFVDAPAGPTTAANAAPAMLTSAPWYQAGLPRDIAYELLQNSDDGAFVVRDSQSAPGNFALTLKAGGTMHNFIIVFQRGKYIIGTDEDGEVPYETLGELILAHTEYHGVLPVELSLDAIERACEDASRRASKGDEAATNHNNNHGSADDADGTSFISPDYQELREVKLQLAALQAAGRKTE